MNFNRIWNLLLGNEINREEHLREFAFDNGLIFSTENDIGLIAQFSDFSLFTEGSDGKIKYQCIQKNLLESNLLFDYSYQLRTGKTSVSIDQTVRLFNSKRLALPRFTLKPENILHTIAKWFGYDDIDFQSDELFSKKFHLSGEFEQLIRKYFDDDVRNLCLKNQKIQIEGSNYYLLLYVEHKILEKTDLKSFYKLSTLIFELLKIKSSHNLSDLQSSSK